MNEFFRAANGRFFAMSGLAAQNLAYRFHLPFAHDEFEVVGQCEEPALAAQRAHLTHMVDVDKRLPVNALEAGSL